MKNALCLLLVALAGCTARDLAPDKFGIGGTFDVDGGDHVRELRSVNLSLQWDIPQPD